MHSSAAESDDDCTVFKTTKNFEKSPGACRYGLFDSDDDDDDDDDGGKGSAGDYVSKRGALLTIADNFMNLLETETKKLKCKVNDHIRGLLEEQEMLNLELEKRKLELDSRSKELDKREADLNEHERQKLDEEELLKSELEMKRLQLDCRSKELDNRETSIELERQKLELEMSKINFSDRIMTKMATEDHRKVETNFPRLVERLKKEVVKHQSNVELQEVHLELIKLLSDMWVHSCVSNGIKRMGEIEEAFKKTCSERFQRGDAEIRALELCIFWEEKLRDSYWQPFQAIVDEKGNPQGLMKKDDWELHGLLGDLKEEWGEEIYNLVMAALTDFHKYNWRGF